MENSIATVTGKIDKLAEKSYGSVSHGSRLATDSDITIKSEYTKADYNNYRGSDKVPTDPYQAMSMCMKAYDKVGIVNRVVNLMSDFTSSGITLNHKIPSKQRLYRKWWKHINGDDVSERLINYVLQCGNAYISRSYSKVPVKEVDKWKSIGKTVRIPTHYDFINPLAVEIAGKDLSTFIRQPILLLKISNYLNTLYSDLSRATGNNKEEIIKEVMDSLPKEILAALKEGRQYIILNREDTISFHYRKKDWKSLAYPMTYCVLENILLLEKMHLADYSALDGAISNIRLWKMGFIDEKNPNNSLIPGAAAFAKLASILENNVVGGVIDVIWGPELDFKESNTNVHNFLGPQKYAQCMAEIFAGLGIPSSMSSGGGSENYNNNYIAMQTMVKTLNYLRNILDDFWTKEVKMFGDSVGATPATLSYKHINFSDETTWFKFLLDMWDREIITDESILDEVGVPYDIEKRRGIRERKQREKGSMPQKSSPYHNNQKNHELTKIAFQQGILSPSEVGLELYEQESGDESLLDIQEEINKNNREKDTEFKSKNEGGRPRGSKDTTKRKTRNTTTPSFAIDWGLESQAIIHDILSPLICQKYAISNIDELNNDDLVRFEKVKLAIFTNLEPLSPVSKEVVYNLLDSKINENVNKCISKKANSFIQKEGRLPTKDELRYINSESIFGV